jgi:hypothetical protein
MLKHTFHLQQCATCCREADPGAGEHHERPGQHFRRTNHSRPHGHGRTQETSRIKYSQGKRSHLVWKVAG